MAILRRQRSPQLFSSRPAGAIRTLLLIAASISLMVYDRQQGHLERVHAALSTLVYPVQAAVDAPYALAGWARERLATHTALVDENARLRQQLQTAQVQLQRLASLQAENTQLRTLMQANTRVEGRVGVAELLSADLDPFRHVVVIDKGTHDGVFTGQTLLDAGGIVGQVTEADPLTSEVTLITDPGQAIQVEVNRTGLRTLAVGSANVGELSLPYLTNNADVKEGDLLVSSGLGGRYPRGYPVGYVTQFVRNPAEPFATVTARAAADLNHGHDVLLYWPLTTLTAPAAPEAPAAAQSPAGKKP